MRRKPLSFTRNPGVLYQGFSIVSGNESAIRRTSSSVAIGPTVRRYRPGRRGREPSDDAEGEPMSDPAGAYRGVRERVTHLTEGLDAVAAEQFAPATPEGRGKGDVAHPAGRAGGVPAGDSPGAGAGH